MSGKFKNLKTELLPPDWSADFLGNLVDYKLGKTPPRASSVYWKEGKYPWVSISDMIPHGVVAVTAEKISQQAHDSVFGGRLVPEGSLLMSFKLTIGRVSRLGTPAFHNEAIISFQPNPDEISPDYLSYYLSQINYKDYQDTAIKGQTLNKGKLDALEIALPPLPEQKKIAHILSTVQRAIEAQERIIQTTTELKKALMHKLITEGLRGEPQKQTDIGPVPESWKVASFDTFATLQRGYDLRKQDFREGPVPVIGATQVIGYHDTANVKAPGVTVVRSGSSAGKPLYIEKDFWAHNVLLYVKDFHGNVPKFVYYKILALDLTQYRQGVAVPTLNKNTFSAIEVSVPSTEDQQQIANTLDAVENKTAVAELKKAQLQDLFRTLLHELMTAKIRVYDTPPSRESHA
jgi:type I restriction enzyme S subunit